MSDFKTQRDPWIFNERRTNIVVLKCKDTLIKMILLCYFSTCVTTFRWFYFPIFTPSPNIDITSFINIITSTEFYSIIFSMNWNGSTIHTTRSWRPLLKNLFSLGVVKRNIRLIQRRYGGRNHLSMKYYYSLAKEVARLIANTSRTFFFFLDLRLF